MSAGACDFGSFGFAKGRLVCRAKTNVLKFGLVVSFFVCLLCISTVGRHSLAGNVFGLGEGGDFHHKC
jgi:hypothetical protein